MKDSIMKPLLIIIAIHILLFSTSCAASPEASICLIPKDYTGVVVIIFDQADGALPEVENDKYIYHIPPSGILKTKVKANRLIKTQEYYYVDNSGVRTKIDYLTADAEKTINQASEIERNSEKIFVSDEQMGSDSDERVPKRIYRIFVIGKLNQLNQLENIKHRFISNALDK